MAGTGLKPSLPYGSSDEFGFKPIENPVHIDDFQATIMEIMGIDHKRFTFKHQIWRYPLTDAHGNMAKIF